MTVTYPHDQSLQGRSHIKKVSKRQQMKVRPRRYTQGPKADEFGGHYWCIGHGLLQKDVRFIIIQMYGSCNVKIWLV
jgi:hypothetical protein